MTDKRIWPLVFVVVFILILIAGLGVFAYIIMPPSQSEIILGLLIILGVSILTVLLFIMAATFSKLDLTDVRQALGLPPGSVRAMIALLLILIWAIVSIFVFRSVSFPASSGGQAASADGVKLAQQLFTTMSTLVVAISAFYFGSNTAITARSAQAGPVLSHPVIRSISPLTGEEGKTDLLLTIEGENFRTPKVHLVRESERIMGKNIIYNATRIQCNITLDKKPGGKWDVIVINEDGSEDKLSQAFEIIIPTITPIK